MIGDNIGPLIWRGIKGRVKDHFREHWLLWLGVVLAVAALAALSVGVWR